MGHVRFSSLGGVTHPSSITFTARRAELRMLAKRASEFFYTYSEVRKAELMMEAKRASEFFYIYIIQRGPKDQAEDASEVNI